jgi:hypothetical protein
VSSGTQSLCQRTVPLGLSTATRLKKFFWRETQGAYPLKAHPGQSAGMVVCTFVPIPCEATLSNLLGTSGHALTPPILDAFRDQLCKIEQLSAIESRHYSGWSEQQ